MRIGQKFVRNGVQYEFFGYSSSKRIRVRVLLTGEIVDIPGRVSNAEVLLYRKTVDAERKRRHKAVDAIEKRLRKAAEAEEDRLRKEVETLTDRVPALCRLREEARQRKEGK